MKFVHLLFYSHYYNSNFQLWKLEYCRIYNLDKESGEATAPFYVFEISLSNNLGTFFLRYKTNSKHIKTFLEQDKS